MESDILFSVIIPTCNRTDLLAKCLDNLAPGKQSMKASMYEVIVTDDGSVSTEQLIKNEYPWVNWVQGPCKGPAANRNNGARNASGEWLLFTDDDCLPVFTWLEEYQLALKENKLLAFEGTILPLGNRNKDFAECPVNTSGGLFWSANICIKNELYREVGGFDEQYKIAAQEDQDLYLRIKKQTDVFFVKDAIVHHPVRIGSLCQSLKKIKSRSLNWLYYVLKNKKELNYRSDFSVLKAGYISQFKALLDACQKKYPRQFAYALAMLFYGMPLIGVQLILFNKLRNRKFQWLSSKSGSEEKLTEVDQKLSGYYNQANWRNRYQQMLGTEPLPGKGEFSRLILDYIIQKNPAKLLDVGCSNGRIFRQLQQLHFSGAYTGIEVTSYLINQNKENHPEANWEKGSAYAIPFEESTFDLCFAFFVLEHLVFPEKGLQEMMRVVKRGGVVVLIFPDFVASGRLSSQQLGFSPNDTAKQKMKKGKLLDAFLSIYDSRIRLPHALTKVHQKVGEFPVNTNLICFNYPDSMSPDFDAVYIASKMEVEQWAFAQGYKVEYPYGKEGELNEKVFMAITK